MGGKLMEQKRAREIQQALALPFAPEDLEWRLQTALEDKMRGLAVPYVTNRAIQNRLDDVVGPNNWYNDYKPWHSAGKKDAQLCGIAIYFEGRGFITKWDGAEDSDIEPVKGGLSDSMKRAAVQWGIGRVLYSMDTVWVDIERHGKSYVIKDSERPKLDKAYLGMLKVLGLTPQNTVEAPKTEPPQGAEKSSSSVSSKVVGEKAETAAHPATSEKKVQPGQASGRKTAPASVLGDVPSPSHTMCEYVVLDTKVQGGMSGRNTLVTLRAPDGKRIQAFVRGARTELTAGTALTNVKLSLRQQDTVAFYVLESYERIARQQAA